MTVLTTIISLFVLLFAITIHEASHGWAAHRLGDPTAYGMGRVSLNPLAHIDPVGTVILPLLLILAKAPVFGWAKPVIVNPYNLKNPRRDNMWISLAGPAANMIAAAASLTGILILKFLKPGLKGSLLALLYGEQGLRPGFYPLEGLMLILYFGVLINMYLAVFNLIPIPPLDGSGILSGILPDEWLHRYERIRPFGFIIIIALILLGRLYLIVRPLEMFIKIIIFF
jgi:Zn-dependent protease